MIFVYRCDVIPFDMTGNNNDTGGPIDEKSNQWFGASISSSGDDGVIVVRLSFFLAAAFLIFEGLRSGIIPSHVGRLVIVAD